MQRAEAGQDNHWVVKLAQGTHSTDVCLTNCAELIVRYREAPGGDRVVQKYITDPLLFEGRKMDLRVGALLRHLNILPMRICVRAPLMAPLLTELSLQPAVMPLAQFQIVDHRCNIKNFIT